MKQQASFFRFVVYLAVVLAVLTWPSPVAALNCVNGVRNDRLLCIITPAVNNTEQMVQIADGPGPEVQIAGTITRSKARVGDSIDLVVTLHNDTDDAIDKTEVDILAIEGVQLSGPDLPWPDRLEVGQYARRNYRVLAQQRGIYNFVAQLRYLPEAENGRGQVLATLEIEPKTLGPYPIPQELWASVLSVLWTLVSGITGFVLAQLQNGAKHRAIEKSALSDASLLISSWIRRAERTLLKGEYPGDAVHFWEDMPLSHPTQWYTLVRYNPNLVTAITTLFSRMRTSNATDLAGLVPDAARLLTEVETLALRSTRPMPDRKG